MKLRSCALLVCLLLAGTSVGVAIASTSKRAVPLKAERAIAKRVPAPLAYLPGWLPQKFFYVTWAYPLHTLGAGPDVVVKTLEIHFIASFPCRGGGWCSDYPDLTYDASAGCQTPVKAEKTFRFGAITVRWGRDLGTPEAWRCIRKNGHETLLSTFSPRVSEHGPPPRALAHFLASAHQARTG